MASVFQSVGCAVGWRSHQILTEAEESPVPDRFRKRSARGVNALRMSLRKRMPLKEVEMNFEENPTWESLEAPEKSQTLQAFAGAAKSAFGTVSQVWLQIRQFDCNLELVSTGIRRLKRLSHAFNSIIVQEESDMTVSLLCN
ncbi:Protein PIMREG [Varanus komodoensis]|nr:Protein PIMREG [Varanus komodoensis]